MKTIININDLRLNDIVMDDEVIFRVIHLEPSSVTLEFLGLLHDDRFSRIVHRRPVTRKKIAVRRMSGWLRERLRL